MNRTWLALAIVAAGCLASTAARAAEIVLPQNRTAYYADEPIEVAVSGLDKGATATVGLAPTNAALAPVRFVVTGDGSCVNSILPPRSLAPASYKVSLDGKETGLTLTIASGVNHSTLFVSSTCVPDKDKREAGENFIVSHAFSFGQLTPDGMPSPNPRGRLSPGLNALENAIKLDLPSIVYMYWTGYVTHKPWGSEKSWAAPDMVEAMRLFNFHTAQRVRRFGSRILYIGTLDEPGLSWGKTPAGGLASGFPNWDEQSWYEQRGWKYTDDPASRPDDDWLKYMTVRCAILKENNAWAKRDLETVWPEAVFSTDLYAPQAVMDGTDPWNQEVNDIPSSHVFLDWGISRFGTTAALYLEKAHDPASKINHAMNGQLFAETVPQPQQRDTYILMRNGLLAGGLYANWWLNCRGMDKEAFVPVNEPVLRLGPLFQELAPTGHDVAVLWSFTEACMRQKDMAAREAKKKTGEQIKLMIASLPENTAIDKDGTEIQINAYSIGGNYKEQVLSVHQALGRAGYPAHIVHERLLPRGALKNYKTLVLVGQTFDLPADVRRAIAEFAAAGGQVVVDKTTTVRFDGALVTEADFKDPAYRWTPLYFAAEQKKFKTAKEASYYWSNYFMDNIVREAVGPVRATLQKTAAKPVFTSDSIHLAGERHLGGEGELRMLLNGYEKLPDIPADQKYWLYNYAPHTATFTLTGIQRGSVVYRIEGNDWKTVARVANPSAPQTATFAPGEMKLYLVAPRASKGIALTAKTKEGALEIRAELKNVKMPWPITVAIQDPAGAELFRVYRALDKNGEFSESFPLGSNAKAGVYSVRVESPVGDLSAQAKVELKPSAPTPGVVADGARVFDAGAIRSFLLGKPALTIAVGSAEHRPLAEKLAADLKSRGIQVVVAAEKQILKRVRYPRVWNPYAQLYKPTGAEKTVTNAQQSVELHVNAEGRVIAKTADGKDLGTGWRKPNTLVTVVGDGFLDWSGDKEICYEAGCKLFVDDTGRVQVLKGELTEAKTTAEFRARWSRPWASLTSYVGGYQLPAQLPEAYAVDSHLLLLGDSAKSELVAALQASDLLPQVVDAKYPGPGKALVSFAWSPFALEKNAILIGATDEAGLRTGVDKLLSLAPKQ